MLTACVPKLFTFVYFNSSESKGERGEAHLVVWRTVY